MSASVSRVLCCHYLCVLVYRFWSKCKYLLSYIFFFSHQYHYILIEAQLLTCSPLQSSSSFSSPLSILIPPPGSLGRQRAITMVIWTQIPHTPVHCDWRVRRWEGTKCHSNRFFLCFCFGLNPQWDCAQICVHCNTRAKLLQRLWELGKQTDGKNELSDSEIGCKYWLVYPCQILVNVVTVLLLTVIIINYTWLFYIVH